MADAPPRQVIGTMIVILDVQIRTAGAQCGERIASAGEARRGKYDVREHLYGEGVDRDIVLLGEFESLIDPGDLETTVVARISNPRLVDDVGGEDMRVAHNRVDGIVQIVGSAADKSSEITRVHACLHGTRDTAKDGVLFAEFVIYAYVVLIAVKGLRGEKQIVRRLRIRRAEIGFG